MRSFTLPLPTVSASTRVGIAIPITVRMGTRVIPVKKRGSECGQQVSYLESSESLADFVNLGAEGNAVC